MKLRFTVTWHPFVLDESTEIWLRSADRMAVTQAVHTIDRELADDPQRKGEEFYADRIFVAEPLAVTYAINEQDRIVQILQVWHR